LRGEQNPPASFPFSCAQRRLRELAGEADPPPFGAGRRGGLCSLPNLLGMRASFPATCSTCFGHREPLPGLAPSKRRCAPPSPPCPGVPSAARRMHTSGAVRSPADGPDQIKGIPLGLVYRGPEHRVHGAVHRCYGRWIKDPRLSRAVLFKSPWISLYLQAGPSTYMNPCIQVLNFMI
jgi:hypothetical protein